MEVIPLKKKTLLIIICLAVVLLAALSALVLRSSLEYKIMSNTEQLKAQLQEEYHMRTKELFESVEVERPWYSLSPFQWTFVVKLSISSDTKYYQKMDRKFIEIQAAIPGNG